MVAIPIFFELPVAYLWQMEWLAYRRLLGDGKNSSDVSRLL
jgi:hypothetical protein